ncbi:hypothetical protein [Pontibacter kalidii]|uniref:hypothetical protein n=1 Tax=Pontibacter kalidii TaxID=2592049 RepID=UPI00224EC5E4|nr:hypothetical protein [Pontibacter kalidii]
MKLILEDIPLKLFLKLFQPEDKVEVKELGDSWHPSSGFVNESILREVRKINQIINYEYDFRGLVYFEALISGIEVVYQDEQYTLKGSRQQLEKVISSIKALNGSSDFPQYNYKFITP